MKSKKRANSKAQKKAEAVVDAFISEGSLKSDPNGSYTGQTTGKFDVPTQDADDL